MDGLDDLKAKYLTAVATVADEAALEDLRVAADASSLAQALHSARTVRSVADPHISRWLAPLAQLDTEPSPFPQVDRPYSSFSQWWKRVVGGLQSGSGNNFCRSEWSVR